MAVQEKDLRRLLRRHEDPAIEFKRQWYGLDHVDVEARARQTGELVRDILSLVNGNATTAGRTSYLIVGVDDVSRDELGQRLVHDIGQLDTAGLRTRVMQLLATACDPPVGDLAFDLVPIDDQNVLVVSIPPSPHVHETIRDIQSQRRHYTERTVFVRNGEAVCVATAAERDSIARLKALKFREARNVAPVGFGVLVGAIVGALAVFGFRTYISGGIAARLPVLAVSGLVGAFMGGAIGWFYRKFSDVLRDWDAYPLWLRLMGIVAISGFFVWFAVSLLTNLAS